MGHAIDTTRVTGRRTLHFASLQEIAADVEGLAKAKQVRTLGNWSAGQVVDHLAVVIHKSIDGFENHVPAVVRFLLRRFLKRRFLTRSMAPGFNLSTRAKAELSKPEIGLEEAVASFRKAYQRTQQETMAAPHPAIGPLTASEWEQLHCRHAELHLSFLVPLDA